MSEYKNYRMILKTLKEEESEKKSGSGSCIIVDVKLRKVLMTKVRRTDGEIIKVGGAKLIGPPTYHSLIIDSLMLKNVQRCKRVLVQRLVKGIMGRPSYSGNADFMSELDLLTSRMSELDLRTSRYLVQRVVQHAVKLANQNKDKFMVYQVKGALAAMREEVFEEKDVIGSLVKKQLSHGDNDDDEDCSICMTGLSGESGCTLLTPCSHVFHYKCILQWLTENKACPNCRRIVR